MPSCIIELSGNIAILKSDEVGTTLIHPETIKANVENLSKSCHPLKDKENANFYFKNLILPFSAIDNY